MRAMAPSHVMEIVRVDPDESFLRQLRAAINLRPQQWPKDWRRLAAMMTVQVVQNPLHNLHQKRVMLEVLLSCPQFPKNHTAPTYYLGSGLDFIFPIFLGGTDIVMVDFTFNTDDNVRNFIKLVEDVARQMRWKQPAVIQGSPISGCTTRIEIQLELTGAKRRVTLHICPQVIPFWEFAPELMASADEEAIKYLESIERDEKFFFAGRQAQLVLINGLHDIHADMIPGLKDAIVPGGILFSAYSNEFAGDSGWESMFRSPRWLCSFLRKT